jgi:hypothetical protein
VRDLAVPEKVRVLSDEAEMVVVATMPKVEVVEAVAAVEAPVAEVVEPELSVDRGKKEEVLDEKSEKK